jgi:hypothetical protein
LSEEGQDEGIDKEDVEESKQDSTSEMEVLFDGADSSPVTMDVEVETKEKESSADAVVTAAEVVAEEKGAETISPNFELATPRIVGGCQDQNVVISSNKNSIVEVGELAISIVDKPSSSSPPTPLPATDDSIECGSAKSGLYPTDEVMDAEEEEEEEFIVPELEIRQLHEKLVDCTNNFNIAALEQVGVVIGGLVSKCDEEDGVIEASKCVDGISASELRLRLVNEILAIVPMCLEMLAESQSL